MSPTTPEISEEPPVRPKVSTKTTMPITQEMLELMSKTQPTKAVPKGNSWQNDDELAKTQPTRTLQTSETGQSTKEVQSQLEKLSSESLNFLDRLAKTLVESKDGKQDSYLKQTFLDFLGIPAVLSAGDVMGFLRGYLNLRNGRTIRGGAEIITAIIAGIPTGPAHKLIDIIDNFLEQDSK